ncbi:ThiF family adenylyltransferase [Cellulomonas sp. Marseille-Q8402]
MAAVQLKPGLRVLRRAPDEVQVGTDPRWAVRVRGLAPEQVERLLRAGDRALDGLPPAVLAGLAATGLTRTPRARPPRRREALVPEALAYGLVGTGQDDDGTDVLRRRARATVAVTGLDRVGTTVAGTLAAAGVGTLVLDDPAPVRPGDVGGPLTAADVGAARTTAAGAALQRLVPSLRVRTDSRGVVPDVAVTVARDAVHPAAAQTALGSGVPHLAVVTREADALVGPFVAPAAPGHDPLPCLRCLDLHRAEADPAWPTVLAQLVARQPPGGRTPTALTGPPAALAAVAGGLAAAEVLAHLDGGTPRTRGAQYEVAVPEVEPRLRRWAAHPECGCAALTG